MQRLVASALEWVGAHARILIAIAPPTAILLSDVGAWLRPYLPALVVAIYASAMVRIDLANAARLALRPTSLLRTGTLLAILMIAIPVLSFEAARLLGLGEDAEKALTYTALAPPFTSAAAVAFLLGANAALALELMVLASLLAPLIGPVVAEFLLGEALPIEPSSLALRIAAMIVGALAIAALLRRWLGPEQIARRARAFDGLSALIMILFAFPLFDGFAELAIANPGATLTVLGLVFVANLAVQLVVYAGLRPFAGTPDAATIAISTGNRNVALYLAALPANPYFTLYVALYQVPMYLTPVIMRAIVNRAGPPSAPERGDALP